jgi:hypothetical protein
MKQNVLGDHLYKFQWVGVIFNVVSVFMVGSTAILSESKKEDIAAAEDDDGDSSTGTALLGVFLVMLGALVQAMVGLVSRI